MAESLPGVVWPEIGQGEMRDLGAMVARLSETERLPAQARRPAQFRQLASLVAFAARASKHFRLRLDEAGLATRKIATPAGLRHLPPMTRRDLQQHLADLDTRAAARPHGPFERTQTSGSSGEPVAVYRSGLNRLLWMAYTLREHRWHGRDPSGRLAVIRPFPQPGPVSAPDWGPPATLAGPTGPALALPIDADVGQLAEWLAAFQPDYMTLYPSVLSALCDAARQGRLALPRLRQVRTIGETLAAGHRAAVRDAFGVAVVDTYSSQEVGVIASECPVSGLYHVMEGIILEILDERGRPVGPGGVGRVVLTDLHSFATPIIRYDIGDYAEAAPNAPCPCGRGLHAIGRIVGRQRNLARRPDGSRFWPLVGFAQFRDVGDIAQYQVVQTALDSLDVRLVVARSLDEAQLSRLRGIIRGAMQHDFAIRFVQSNTPLPRGPGGKFEEFVCAVPDD